MNCKLVLAAALILLLAPEQLPAYTDPGSGALLWQMIVAGFVGSLYYLRKFAAWLRRKDPNS